MSRLLDKFCEDYSKILESSEFYDAEILVGKEPDTKIFRVHSLILKIRSDYFRTALSEKWIREENNITKFEKQNISPKIFDIIIKYLYSGTVSLFKNDFGSNVELLIAADELCLDELCAFIEQDYLLENKKLLKKNLVLIQEITTKFTQFKELSKYFRKTIRQDPSLIFKAKDFTNIKKDALLDIIKKNDSLNGIMIWDKLVEWCIAQSSGLSSNAKTLNSNQIQRFGKLLRPFIPYIDFMRIPPSDFSQKIKPFKDIFNTDFYVKILEYYSFGGNSEGFADDSESKECIEDFTTEDFEHSDLIDAAEDFEYGDPIDDSGEDFEYGDPIDDPGEDFEFSDPIDDTTEIFEPEDSDDFFNAPTFKKMKLR